MPAAAACDRPGAPRGLARRARRSRSRCSTRAPARRCSPTSPSSAGWPGCSGRSCPGLDVKPLVAELKRARRGGARLRARGRQPARLRRRVRRRPRRAGPAGRRRRAAGAGHRVGRRHAAVARSSRRARRAARPGRPAAGPLLFSGPPRAGLLHADPHPGNFRLLDDGRLVVLDFGAVDRLPGRAARARSAGCSGSRSRTATREGVFDGLRAEGFVRAGDRPRRRAPAGLPRPDPRAGPRRTRSGSPAPGCARRRCGSATRARRRTAPGRS